MKSPYACYLLTLPKFNSSPLKSYRNPIGKDRLPNHHFSVAMLKFWLPQKGWFIMENPIKMDDLGLPLFLGFHPFPNHHFSGSSC